MNLMQFLVEWALPDVAPELWVPDLPCMVVLIVKSSTSPRVRGRETLESRWGHGGNGPRQSHDMTNHVIKDSL